MVQSFMIFVHSISSRLLWSKKAQRPNWQELQPRIHNDILSFEPRPLAYIHVRLRPPLYFSTAQKEGDCMLLGLRMRGKLGGMSELNAVELCSKSLLVRVEGNTHPVWPEQHIVGAGASGRGQRAHRPLEPCIITVLRPSSVRPSVRDPLREPLMDGNGTNEAIFSHSAAMAASGRSGPETERAGEAGRSLLRALTPRSRVR